MKRIQEKIKDLIEPHAYDAVRDFAAEPARATPPTMLATSSAVAEACKSHGGFYLGSIGGPAARLAQDCIRKVEVLEYPELGMEAVWRIEVEDFPAFIVVDDKGNDFFADVSTPLGTTIPTRAHLEAAR